MTPLARRLIVAVVGTLLVALVVLVASLSLGPNARAILVLLAVALVVVGVIVALLARWFRSELADTNTTSAVEIAAAAGVDADALGDDEREHGRGDGAKPPREETEPPDRPDRPDRE